MESLDTKNPEQWIETANALIEKVFQKEITVMRERFKNTPSVIELDMKQIFREHINITPGNFFFVTDFHVDQFLTKIWFDKERRRAYWLVHFGSGLEGPPGHTHGGALSTALDQAIGLTAIFCHGMSGSHFHTAV